jgi:cytoskeletal protein CcmA (bactofilin family)
VIKGKVTAEIIDLRGEIHDTLTAKKSLFIRSTGNALGSVQYAEIEIEKGGEIEGALNQGAEPITPAPTSPNPSKP